MAWHNLDVIQAAWIGCKDVVCGGVTYNVTQDDLDGRCVLLSNGDSVVVIRYPYATWIGNKPEYGVAVNNGPFVDYPDFVSAFDFAAARLS